MARRASAAKAAMMVVSSDASVPLATIAQAATTPLWLQVYAKSPKVKDVLAEASAANAKVVVVTVNAGTSAGGLAMGHPQRTSIGPPSTLSSRTRPSPWL